MQDVARSAPQSLGDLRQREDQVRERLAKIRERLSECVAMTRELSRLEERIATSQAGAYRTDANAFADKIAAARAARAERSLLRTQEAALMMELEEIRAKLEGRGIRHVSLPVLEHIAIASPCDVSWADMKGDSDVRFCQKCDKHVYNLSMMSREEAAAVLGAAAGTELCVRLHRRTDGTVITDDCAVGLRRRRFWRRTSGLAAAGILLAALGAVVYSQLTCSVHMAASQGAVTDFR